TVTVDNATAPTLGPSYSLMFNYTTGTLCGSGNPVCIGLLVQNESGDSVTVSKNMTSQNNATFYLSANYSLISSQGRYVGTVKVHNTSSPAENANITIILDAPISIDSNTGAGSFSGALPSNAKTYQSFYVNASSIQNSTGMKVNISWSPTQDIDLFLFDNSSTPKLLAKSINKSSTSESWIYSFIPPQGGMWEIRIYGNSTTAGYSGSVYFTTLNSDIRALNYSKRNVSDSNESVLILTNNGTLNISNVLESKEIFYVIRSYGNGTKNFTFMVPDSTIAQKIKVSLNWTAVNSAYLLNLYKPDKSIASTSRSKYVYANASGAEMEEYNETSSSIATGIWTLEVKNGTNTTSIDPYNVTIYIKVNEANWITTNYTTSSSGFSFSSLGQPNSSYIVDVNFTVPTNAINGIYEGSIKYLDRNDAGIAIPVRVNVTSPALVANGTWNSTTVRIDENINATLTKVLNITVNNTGSYAINNITTINSTSLMYGGKYINFSYQAPTSISANGYGILNITFNLNSSITEDTQGIYKGWIFLSTSGSTYPSSPYQGFNLTIEVNLTNRIEVRVTGVETYDSTPNWIVNASKLPRNVTVKWLNIYYVNGTQFKGTSLINYTNISSANLYQRDTDYWASNLYKSEAFSTGFEPTPGSGDYQFNFTVLSTIPGGEYEVRISLTNFNGAFTGGSSNKTLFINNTGFFMNSSTSSIVVYNSSVTYFPILIYNFGSLSGPINLKFEKGSCPITVALPSPYCNAVSGSCSNPGDTNISFTVINGNDTSGQNNATWKITGSGAGSCTAYVYGYGGSLWFNNISLPITVLETNGTQTSQDQSQSQTQNTTSTGQAAKYMNITSYSSLIQIAQNSSITTTVSVKNINTTRTQDIKLVVENISSNWTSVTPALTSVTSLNSTTFTVTFNIPSDAEIKDYNAVFKAISNYANATANFILRVTPSESQKAAINQDIASYRANMTQLSLDINESKSNGYNVSLAESKFLELRSAIEQAEAYASQNDYFNAYRMLSSIQTLVDQTTEELSKASLASAGGFDLSKISLPSWAIYAIVGVSVAVAFLLVFVFMSKGKPKTTTKETSSIQKIKLIFSKPKESRHPGEENPWDKLKEKWANIKKDKSGE
ncbi:MAG TPA: hypothetical protein VJ343_02040, partial [archaeon]|nr:hypothetical protein [archaeon]